MLGPRHLPSYLEVVNFESDLEKHHKKLGQIQNGQKKKLFDKELPAVKTFAGREKVLKFHNSEKALAIEKDNELLLGRLVEISRKKQNPIFATNELKAKTTTSAKSLNENHRKREKDRIAAENEAFARRLLSQQPSFNRRKLDEDFDKHAERVRLMQKWVGHKSKIKLPPIQYNKYEDMDMSRKSQSGKEKRTVKDISKKKRRKSNKIDEKEEIAEEEAREREEAEIREMQAQQQKEFEEKLRQEELARKEEEERELQEQREKEEAERKAKEAKEQEERAERLKKEEEERLRLEAEQQNAKPKVEGNPMVGLIQGSAGLKKAK